MSYSFSELSYAFAQPSVTGCLKASNSDFRVDEIMPVVPSGEGEHLWLKIVKDGSNTDWVAQQLAKFAGIKANLVSYAGM
ncbi:tRNA pseudouridine(13) synthase, partial [hydrothermal vent metagenome]